MKANELRIGNLVICEQTTHIISELGENHVLSYWIKTNNIEHYVSTYDDIKPISLTEEWLIKFGFELNIGCGLYPEHRYFDIMGTYCASYRIYISDENITFHLSIDWQKYYPTLLSIKYVHQLQNIYFALTGNELTIK